MLIYLADKAAAFAEFFRVLQPGGRVSLFEPINNYFPDTADDYWGFDARPVRDLVEKIWEYEGRVESEYANDPMMNFNTKDLVAHAEQAGFGDVHIDLSIDVKPGSWVVDWDRLLNTSPNPNANTAGEDIHAALSPEEVERFERHIRPLADAGQGAIRSAFAYVMATKGQPTCASPTPTRGAEQMGVGNLEHLGEEIVEAVGRGGASELLDAITSSEADRAALIGRLSLRDDAQWLAELLIDLETDEVARLQVVEGLRLALAWG